MFGLRHAMIAPPALRSSRTEQFREDVVMRAHEGYRELEKASPDRHRVRARLLRQESSDRSMARYAVAQPPRGTPAASIATGNT